MENDYEHILARLNTAKSNFNNEGQSSSELAALGKEFDSIAQAFKSLPSSFTIKAQIEACENYSKICEEKRIIRLNEEYNENHLSALDRLNEAKQKIKNHKERAEYFTELSKEFAAIEQVFRSLPNSFDVKPQIEECKESCRRCEESQKRCEEKQQRKAKAEEIGKTLTKKATGLITGAIIGGIGGVIFAAIGSGSGIELIIAMLIGAIWGMVGAFGNDGYEGAGLGFIAGVIIFIISCIVAAATGDPYSAGVGIGGFFVFGIFGLILGAIIGKVGSDYGN